MLYNPVLRRLDAHCTRHASCKMDRVVGKGVIGLSTEWLLQADNGGKDDHEACKATLSALGGIEDRRHGRATFVEYASAQAGVWDDVLAKELELRGNNDEPAFIVCAPSRHVRPRV